MRRPALQGDPEGGSGRLRCGASTGVRSRGRCKLSFGPRTLEAGPTRARAERQVRSLPVLCRSLVLVLSSRLGSALRHLYDSVLGFRYGSVLSSRSDFVLCYRSGSAPRCLYGYVLSSRYVSVLCYQSDFVLSYQSSSVLGSRSGSVLILILVMVLAPTLAVVRSSCGLQPSLMIPTRIRGAYPWRRLLALTHEIIGQFAPDSRCLQMATQLGRNDGQMSRREVEIFHIKNDGVGV